MGWRSLFGTKEPKRPPDPRVRWFGKLPSYGDYYAPPAVEAWVVEFHTWLMSGWEIYQRRLKQEGVTEDRLPASRMVLRLPKSHMTVLVAIQDHGGDSQGRPFPFCILVGVPSAYWVERPHETTQATWRVVEDLAWLQQEVPSLIEPAASPETLFGDRSVDLSPVVSPDTDDSWRDRAHAIAFDDWLAGALPHLAMGEQASWVEYAHAWGNSLARQNGAGRTPTMRLPLSTEITPDVQVMGWMNWLAARQSLGHETLSLMLSGDRCGSLGYLNVIPRALNSEDFLLGTPLATGSAQLEDLCTIRATDRFPDRRVSSPRTWLEFVESEVSAS